MLTDNESACPRSTIDHMRAKGQRRRGLSRFTMLSRCSDWREIRRNQETRALLTLLLPARLPPSLSLLSVTMEECPRLSISPYLSSVGEHNSSLGQSGGKATLFTWSDSPPVPWCLSYLWPVRDCGVKRLFKVFPNLITSEQGKTGTARPSYQAVPQCAREIRGYQMVGYYRVRSDKHDQVGGQKKWNFMVLNPKKVIINSCSCPKTLCYTEERYQWGRYGWLWVLQSQIT